MGVLQFFIGLVPTIYDWVWPQGWDYFWLVVIGICGMMAHLGLTKAIAIAEAATILPMDYLRLPITFLIGYVFYAETLDIWVGVGASVIFLANYLHLKHEARNNV